MLALNVTEAVSNNLSIEFYSFNIKTQYFVYLSDELQQNMSYWKLS